MLIKPSGNGEVGQRDDVVPARVHRLETDTDNTRAAHGSGPPAGHVDGGSQGVDELGGVGRNRAVRLGEDLAGE